MKITSFCQNFHRTRRVCRQLFQSLALNWKQNEVWRADHGAVQQSRSRATCEHHGRLVRHKVQTERKKDKTDFSQELIEILLAWP